MENKNIDNIFRLPAEQLKMSPSDKVSNSLFANLEAKRLGIKKKKAGRNKLLLAPLYYN